METQVVILSALAAAGHHGGQAAQTLEFEIAGRSVTSEYIDLTRTRIEYCRGCGACTEQTPGRCILQDDMQNLLPLIVNCRWLIVATPIFFGGHHPELKKAVDRFLPLAAPVYAARGGELHHRMRYPRRPALLGVGLLQSDPSEGETFCRLIGRHAVNLDLPAHACAVFDPAAEKLPTLRRALDHLGVTP